MTIKGTLDSLLKLAEKIDSILGKLRYVYLAAILIGACSHYSTCNDRDELKKKVETLSKKK